MELIIKYVVPEIDVIMKSPIPFLLSLTVITILIWRVLAWRYAVIIDGYEARNKLQADQIADYKAKLSGASPDEAKARLDALETMVAELSSRLLSEEQSRKVTSILSADPGRAYITLAVTAANARLFHAALEKCFSEAKYEISTWMAMSTKITPNNDVCLKVPDVDRLTSRQRLVLTALRSVDIEVAVEHEADHPANKYPIDIWLVVR